MQPAFRVEYLYNVSQRFLEVRVILICYYSTQNPALINVAQNRANLTI
jgi:hypothetical protein